jgi:hypothetical protein
MADITIKGNKAGTMMIVGGNRSYGVAGHADGGIIGALQGIMLGAPSSILSDGTFGRHLQVGVNENTTDGSPFSQSPCLQLDIPGFWRFRWSIKPGVRSIYVNTKQITTITPSYSPSLVIKMNPLVGLLTDVTSTAASSQDWVTIGPVSFVATGNGAVWVELHNNNTNEYNTPCLFDHIVAL